MTPEEGIGILLDELKKATISVIKEFQQYREIGTVEECREAMEKQKARCPREVNGEYGYYICPACGSGIYVSDEFETHKFCLCCGQAILWVERRD